MVIVRLCILTVFGCLIPAGTEAFDVIGERITGEYNGLALMRCSLLPKTLEIDVVEWYKGSPQYINMVYLGIHERPPKYPKRGLFSGRNVTGTFSSDASFHDISIMAAVPGDVANYFCRVKPKNDLTFKYTFVQLTLVAPPADPPFISDINGTEHATSNCSNLDVIPVYIATDRNTSFVCQVGPTRPYPVVEWHYSGPSLINNISYTDNNDMEVLRLGAKRQIDIMLFSDNQTLMCMIKVPDERTGLMKDEYLCLQVAYITSRELNTNRELLLVFIIPVGLVVMTGWSMLYMYLIYKKSRDGINQFAQQNIKKYRFVTKAGCIGSAGNVLMSLFVVFADTQCSGSFLVNGHIESHNRGSPAVIALLVYLWGRLAFDFCGVICAFFTQRKRTRNQTVRFKSICVGITLLAGPSVPLLLSWKKQGWKTNDVKLPVLTVFGFDIIVTMIYCVGFLWSYITGGCFSNKGAIVCLTSTVFLLILICLTLMAMKVSNGECYNCGFENKTPTIAGASSPEKLFCEKLQVLGFTILYHRFLGQLCAGNTGKIYLQNLGEELVAISVQLQLQDVTDIEKVTVLVEDFVRRMRPSDNLYYPLPYPYYVSILSTALYK